MAFLLIIAAVYDTKIIRIGSQVDLREKTFSAHSYAEKKFQFIHDDILSRAVDIDALIAAISVSQKMAIKHYGFRSSGIGAVMPVSFHGEVKYIKNGLATVMLDSNAQTVKVRVQIGPAINGTNLRDASDDITFGDFKNQIEYQNVAAALNDVMKSKVLLDVKQDSLIGKKIKVVGVFRLINPHNWLITPISLKIK